MPVRLREDQRLERPHGPERHQRHEVGVFQDDAFIAASLDLEVVAEQAGAGLRSVRTLASQLLRRLIGDRFVGPDLPVRMGVAGTHHRPTVLEDLNVSHPWDCAELEVLVGPSVDDEADGRPFHGTEREVVAGREADDSADAALGLRDEELARFRGSGCGVG